MGNEKSIPTGLKIEGNIKVSDAWIQKAGVLAKDMTSICVFEQLLKNENIQTLENFSKNLMLYRHPFILKYISSWKTNKTLYVATEFGKPLTLVLHDLLPMQLCIGLYNILKAIIFLRDMALLSHNNISKDAIYVTTDGYWKLGRLELMASLINKQDKPIDLQLDADQKGFATLACEILEKATNDDVPAVEEFISFCKISKTTSNTHFFQQLQSHHFFSHKFIKIYSFLSDLPVKNEDEKSFFFETLADELLTFPEDVTACQLGNLLLSRLVLLNAAAQDFLLPRIFSPKSEENSCLFSMTTLQNYFSSKLQSMFSIRDSQVRLILLRYFPLFRVIFTKQQLQDKILPELLVGIKDTNETLVAATLHTLADLVPILGASVVVGKGRAKLFADGRPLLNNHCVTKEECIKSASSISGDIVDVSYSLPERPSPDGGEDFTNLSTVQEQSLDTIDDYEEHEKLEVTNNEKIEIPAPNLATITQLGIPSDPVIPITKTATTKKIEGTSSLKLASNGGTNHLKREIVYPSVIATDDDLSTLDIKCSRSKNDSQFDDIELMFKDMEPVISRTAIMKVSENSAQVSNVSKFKAAETDFDGFDGWGEDANDWVDPDED